MGALDERACRRRLPTDGDGSTSGAGAGGATRPPHRPSTEQPAWAKRLHRRQQLTRRDHGRPYATRRRCRQLQPGQACVIPIHKENFHAIQKTAGALRRHAAACHPAIPARSGTSALARPACRRRTGASWHSAASPAVLMAGGLVWRSAQSIVTPYVVEVDNACALSAKPPHRIGPAMHRSPPPGPLHRPGALAVHRPHRRSPELAGRLRLRRTRVPWCSTSTPA